MKYKFLILFVLLLSLSLVSSDWTPQSNVNLRWEYNVTGAPYVNATTYYGNGSQLTGITSTTSNSSTWWASVSGWVSGYFKQTGNDLDFNETKLNETIEAIDTATNTSMKTYVDGTFVTQANEGNLNVNSSSYWDDMNTINATQMEDSSGTLNILESWVNSLWCALTGCTMTGNLDMSGNNILNVSNYTGEKINVTCCVYLSNMRSSDGNSINIQPTSDEDDYFSFKTPAHRPTIKREGGKFIYFDSSNVYDVGISLRDDDTYSGTLNYEKDGHLMTLLGKNSPVGIKTNSEYLNYFLFETYNNQPQISVYNGTKLVINDSLDVVGDGNFTGNITASNFLGSWNGSSLYVPYTGASQNIDLGANNFSVNTDSLFVDKETGNVGIGTATPNAKLEVAGSVNITGTLSYNQCAENMSYINKLGGFCIDKYEAVALNSDGSWNESSDDDAWRNTGDPSTANLLAAGGKAGSIAGKYPWVYIKQTEARTACENAGKHLCTDEEWLAAVNIKGQVYNLATMISDCTVSTNCIIGNNLGPNGGDACYGGNMTDCVSSEGVYDMVGNVWEWTNETADVVNPNSFADWYYINTTDMTWSNESSVDDGTYGKDGTYFPTTVNGKAVERGGNWYSGARAGPFCAALSNGPTDVYDGIGFRCCSSSSESLNLESGNLTTNYSTVGNVFREFMWLDAQHYNSLWSEWVDGILHYVGKVGVNVENPLAGLHVVGDGGYSALFMGGNVGIGTVSPNSTLDVQGNIHVNSSILSPTGTLTLGGTGGTYNEDLVFNFEQGSNQIRVSSSSNAQQLQWSGYDFRLSDDKFFGFGNLDSSDVFLGWETTGNDNFQIGTKVGNAAYSGYVSLMEQADTGNANRSPSSTSADPVFRVYSSDATQANDYIEMYHDQTESFIKGGNGNLNFDTGGAEINFMRDGNGAFGIQRSPSWTQVLFKTFDATGNQIVITNDENRDSNHDHPVQTDPTLFIHSDTNPDDDNTEWVSLAYINATDNALIDVGKGDLVLGTNLHLQNDSDKVYFGQAQDVSIEMNGTSFNILDEVSSIVFNFQSFLKYVFDANVEVDGNITATYFKGNGSELTGIIDTNTNCSSDGSCGSIAYDSEINKTYVDAQDSAQDACSEITGCVENAITDGNTNWDNSYGFYDNITNFTGTMTDGKICIYDSSQQIINCTYTDQTGEAGNPKAGDGTYLYNDSTTMYLNATYAGINLEVNGSDYWDGLGSPSDINAADITDDGTYRLQSWNNLTGIPHATPSNGDTTHFSLADEIYDWVISLGYLTSVTNIFDQWLNTTSGVTFENVSTKAIYGNGDVDTFINWTGAGGDQLEFFAGGISFIHMIEGAGDGIAFNQDSNDIDWRVESDDHTHALAVDGGTNKVRMDNYTNCDTIDTDASGILSCGTDDDTTYTAGSNLTLNVAEFNWDSSWVDTLFPRITELVGLIGNWSADKSDYWNASTDLDGVIATDEITELKIDFNTACAAGNHLYVNGNNLACEADDDTTYSAGNGIALAAEAFSVAGNTALTQDADGLSVTADGIGDTQLAYNTGQHLTTTSNVVFSQLNVSDHFRINTANITCFNSACTWYMNATSSCQYYPSGGLDCGAA